MKCFGLIGGGIYFPELKAGWECCGIWDAFTRIMSEMCCELLSGGCSL